MCTDRKFCVCNFSCNGHPLGPSQCSKKLSMVMVVDNRDLDLVRRKKKMAFVRLLL